MRLGVGRLRRGAARALCSSAVAAAFAGLAPPAPALAQSTDVLSGDSLLERLVDPAAATSPLPGGTRVVQYSSHDRSGGNVDGGSYGGPATTAGLPPTFVRREPGGYVLLDLHRPGCLARAWFTGSVAGTQGELSSLGRLQLFFDGEEQPRVDEPAVDFFAGRDPRFPNPLVGDFHSSSGGNYSYVPFCFARSLKLRVTGNPGDASGWYQLTTLVAPRGTAVETFDPDRLDTATAAARLAQPGAPPARRPEIAVRRELRPGVTRLARLRGAGSVRYLKIGVRPFDIDTLRSLTLRVTCDGAAAPQVDVPLAGLFGDGLELRAIRANAFGMSPGEGTGYLALPIPFADGASISLAADRPASVQLDAWTGAALPGAGTLYGEQHVEQARLGEDFHMLSAAGSGRLAALVLDLVGSTGSENNGLQWFMEGDERVHVDGSRSPSIYGTGTEDTFNGGFYYNQGPFSLPTHGAGPLGSRAGSRGAQSQYRVFAGDGWLWGRGIEFGMEHGGGDEDTDETATVTTFSYRDAARLVPTDSVRIGDPASEAEHGLAGRFERRSLTSYFEGDRDGSVPASTRVVGGFVYPAPPPELSPEGVTAGGIEFSSPVSFDLALDPANHGAVLRRLLDQGAASDVEVLVDGSPAGLWESAQPGTYKRWLEDDFELPAALTEGRGRVQITLVPANGTSGTAFGLEAFSRR